MEEAITPAPAHQLLMDESLQVIRKNNETWSQGEWILASQKNLIKEELATLPTHYAKKIIVFNPWAQEQRPHFHLNKSHRSADTSDLFTAWLIFHSLWAMHSPPSTHSAFFVCDACFPFQGETMAGCEGNCYWWMYKGTEKDHLKKASWCIPGTTAAGFHWAQAEAFKMTPAIITNKSCSCFFFLYFSTFRRIELFPKCRLDASAEPRNKGLSRRCFFFSFPTSLKLFIKKRLKKINSKNSSFAFLEQKLFSSAEELPGRRRGSGNQRPGATQSK